MIEDKVRSVLFTACGVQPGQRVVVGYSGGADSLCLLHALTRLPLQVLAAHYDHRLRPESGADAEQCRRIAATLGVDFLAGTGDVKAFAAEKGLSIEEAARIMRYQFLFETAEHTHADAVATAHHADDQVETILMHLMRGAGPDGLSGMRYRGVNPLGSSAAALIRPLLGIWREDILQYCRKNDLDFLEDATNQESTYFRNRIRLELIPELETYNRQIRQHLWQTAAILADENGGLEDITERNAANMITRRGESWIELDQAALSSQPVWLQRRIFRKALFTFKQTLRDLDFDQVERAIDFLDQPHANKYCQLNSDLELFRLDSKHVILAQQRVLLVDLWPQVEADAQPLSEKNCMMNLAGGWKFTLKNGDALPVLPIAQDPWKASLDADKLTGALTLGIRQRGDLFDPYGMAGAKIKLGDFFTNAHLPARARDHWPVVRSGGRIIWIPGFRIAEFCKLTSNTKNVIQLELMKEKPA